MDKKRFITWLLEKYKVSDINYESLASKLNNGILNGVNYGNVADYIDKNNKCMPSAIEINRIARDNNYFITDTSCEAIRYARELDKLPKYTMQDLPEDLKIKIRNLCKKIGAKTVLEDS